MPGKTSEKDIIIGRLEAELAAERKRSLELQADCDLFQSLIDGLPDEIWHVDKEGHTALLNRAAHESLGFTSFKDNPKPLADLLAELEIRNPDGALRPPEDSPLICALRGEVVPFGEEYIRSPSTGEVRFRHYRTLPVRDAAGEIVGALGIVRDATEKKQMDDRLRRQNAVLSGINQIFQEAIACETIEELGKTCLAVAEAITGSKFGFIDEIGPDGLLYSIAISDPGWEQCTMFDRTAGGRKLDGFKIHGLYGRVMIEGKSLLTNDPASHPDSIGLPPGHPPLTSFLGVPILREGRAAGIIAVANRDGGYHQDDLEALEALAPVIVESFAYKRAGRTLQESQKLYRAIAANLPNGAVFVVDRDLRYILAEGEAVKMEGMGPADFEGRTIFEVLDPEAAAQYEPLFRKALAGEPFEWEHESLGRHYITRGAPLVDADGGIYAALAVSYDITERRRAEARTAWLARFPEENPNPVLRVSVDGSVLYCNPAAALLPGWECGDGRPAPGAIAALVDRAFAEGRQVQTEIVLGERDFLVSISPFPEERYANVYGRDVTDRNRYEAALRQSLDDLDRAQGVGRIGSWRLDVGRNSLTWSKENYRIFGVPRGTPLTYETFLGIVHPDDRDYVDRKWQAAMAGETYDIEHRLLVNGEIKWVREKAYLEFDDAGNLAAGFGTTQDVTGIKMAMKQVEQQRAQLEAALESSPIATIFYDVDRKITYMNPTAERLLGFTQEEARLLPQGEGVGLKLNWPDPAETAAERYELDEFVGRKALGGEIVLNEEFLVRPKGGSDYIHVLTNAAPIVVGDGEIIGAVQTITDITDLVRVREAAEAANRAKSIFLANMSHEIRTPMNGILGMIELAVRKAQEPQVRDYLKYARESAIHLLEVINDVLDLSRIEAGKVELARENFSLTDFLGSVVEPLRPAFSEKSLVLGLNLDPAVPDRLVGDPGRLRQVFVNLIGNALKFTEKGSVSISATLDGAVMEASALGGLALGSATLEGANRSENLLRLLFTVKDTGIGIPCEHLETVFHSFEQVHTALHAKYEGTGLGLSISKNLVELMGGKIWVESREGAGSTFFFTVMFETLSRAKVESGTTAPPPMAGRPLNILVAEDNKINRIYIESLLANDGHHAVIVETGLQALEKLAEGRFDLVLMDIRMPDMNGDEAVRTIRRNPPPGVNPKVPVVALTAYSLRDEQEHFMESGFDAYLTKPVEIDKLREILAKLG